jgi:hypothetical protein
MSKSSCRTFITASMEQPCWYEDCPLLVRAPIKLHLLSFVHYEFMLTSAPHGAQQVHGKAFNIRPRVFGRVARDMAGISNE